MSVLCRVFKGLRSLVSLGTASEKTTLGGLPQDGSVPSAEASGRKDLSHYITQVSSAMNQDWGDETKAKVAEELAEMLVLLPRLFDMPSFNRWAYVDLIFSCLNKEFGAQGIVVARSLRMDLERYRRRQSYWHSRAFSWLPLDVPLANLLTGLVSSLLLIIGVSYIVNYYMSDIAGDHGGLVYDLAASGTIRIVTISAFLGCIVSMFSSFQKYADITNFDPFLLFVTTTMKPLVSAIIAMIIVLILLSKIVTITGVSISFADSGGIDGSEETFLILIGFFSGFSERFVMSVMRKAEDKLAPPSSSPPEGPAKDK